MRGTELFGQVLFPARSDVVGGVFIVEGQCAVKVVVVPVLNFFGLQGALKRLDLFALALAFGDPDDHGEVEVVVVVFKGQHGVFDVVACFGLETDRRKPGVHVGQRLGSRLLINFDELQVLGVVGNRLLGEFGDACRVLNVDESFLMQQRNRPPVVGTVNRQGDGGAVG